MDYSNENYVKETGLTDKDLELLRETFKVKYAREKGWNPNKLTQEQINEIKKQAEWSKPMLLS